VAPYHGAGMLSSPLSPLLVVNGREMRKARKTAWTLIFLFTQSETNFVIFGSNEGKPTRRRPRIPGCSLACVTRVLLNKWLHSIAGVSSFFDKITIICCASTGGDSSGIDTRLLSLFIVTTARSQLDFKVQLYLFMCGHRIHEAISGSLRASAGYADLHLPLHHV
jgi:hypothetical protein